MADRPGIEGALQETNNQPAKTPQPSWIQPMLATLTRERFYKKGWIYEHKLGGQRCLAFKQGNDLRLYSRNRKLINNSYPDLLEALAKEPVPEFIIDGEIVAFKGGRASFELLQNRMHVLNPRGALRERVPVLYYIFDILYLNGYDMMRLPLLDRKETLKHMLAYEDPIRYVTHKTTGSEKYFQEACVKGWEGLIAKRADSIYQPRRSKDWLKFKCVNEQEFVIGGWTDPRRSRIGFGAILVGYYDRRKLKYAGKIGTGFSDQILSQLTDTFNRIATDKSPFDDYDPGKKEFHWVQPKLIAQVSFAEWTSDGRLRHPSYKGLRDDKKPTEVVREM